MLNIEKRRLGPKWKKDKRLLSPLLLKRNIGQYFPVMLNHSQVLRRILEHEADRPAFDIQHYLHRAVADIVNGECFAFHIQIL